MLKLLVRQAVKAAPTSLHLPSPRQIHSIRAPYSGPPSYDMIARRFSPTEVDPQAYFTRKRQQAGMARDISIDIGDIGRDPNGYDVLIKDVKHETLETTIAEELGIGYQSEAEEADAKALVRECTGYIHGRSRRPIVPFIVGWRGEARWVFFILDSTAPLTYLSAQTSGLFHIKEGDVATVTIGGHSKEVIMSPSRSQFGDINLLGSDFCSITKTHLTYDYANQRVKLLFGGGGAL